MDARSDGQFRRQRASGPGECPAFDARKAAIWISNNAAHPLGPEVFDAVQGEDQLFAKRWRGFQLTSDMQSRSSACFTDPFSGLVAVREWTKGMGKSSGGGQARLIAAPRNIGST